MTPPFLSLAREHRVEAGIVGEPIAQWVDGSVDILATSLKFERAIDRLRGFLWGQ